MIPIAIAFLLSSPDAKSKTMNDLAKSVAAISKRPAIAIFPSYDTVKMPDDAKSVDDIVSPLRKEGFASLESDVAMVYQQGIPRSHWGVLRGLVLKDQKNDASFKPVTIPQSAVKGSLITFETKDTEGVRLGSLANLDLPRRIQVSPYFNFENSTDFPLAISAKNMPYSEFVKALTRGIGGKLLVDAKTYMIGFDANAFRANVAKLVVKAEQGVNEGRTPSGSSAQFNGGNYTDYQEYQDASMPAQSTSKPALLAALQLLNSTVNQMTDQLLEQTFAYKGTATRINLATFFGLQDATVNYLRSATTPETPGAEVSRRPRPNSVGGGSTDYASLIRRVDAKNPGRITITTDFRLSLELNVATNGRGPRNGAIAPGDTGNTVTIQVL